MIIGLMTHKEWFWPVRKKNDVDCEFSNTEFIPQDCAQECSANHTYGKVECEPSFTTKPAIANPCESIDELTTATNKY